MEKIYQEIFKIMPKTLIKRGLILVSVIYLCYAVHAYINFWRGSTVQEVNIIGISLKK